MIFRGGCQQAKHVRGLSLSERGLLSNTLRNDDVHQTRREVVKGRELPAVQGPCTAAPCANFSVDICREYRKNNDRRDMHVKRSWGPDATPCVDEAPQISTNSNDQQKHFMTTRPAYQLHEINNQKAPLKTKLFKIYYS